MKLLSVGLLLLTSLARAQEPTPMPAPIGNSFEATGQAPIMSGDRVRARERALDDAFRQVVEHATQALLDPAIFSARSSELKLRIFPKARIYVGNYRVLDEGAIGTTFQVHLSAQIATARLSRDLSPFGSTTSKAPEQVQLPRLPNKVLVCSDPRGRDSAVKLTTAMHREASFLQPCDEMQLQQLLRAGEGEGALVVWVTVDDAGTIRGSDLAAAHARAEAKWIDREGKVKGDEAKEKDGYGAKIADARDRAATLAIELAVSALEPVVIAKTPKATGTLRARIEGVSQFSDLTAVIHALSSIPGVFEVTPARFRRGQVDVEISTGLSEAQIIGSLGRMSFPGLKIQSLVTPEGMLSLLVANDPGIE